MTDMLKKVALVIRETRQQYTVEGTPADPTKAYGPPWKAPWFVIDVSKAEPEVGWPGELIAEYDEPQKAHDYLGSLVAKAAIEALRSPTDEMLEAGYETISCPTCGYSSLKEQAAINWQAMIDKALEGRE